MIRKEDEIIKLLKEIRDLLKEKDKSIAIRPTVPTVIKTLEVRGGI